MKYPRILSAVLFLAACSSAAPSRTGSGGSGGEKSGGRGGSGGGTIGGSGGSGGSKPSGGNGGSGGAAGADAGTGNTPDALAAAADAGPDLGSARPEVGPSADGPPRLEECPKPSIDRITAWNATGEGKTVPMSGSVLVKEGDHYVAKQMFVGNEWHVLEVLIGNVFEFQVDLSQSMGFTLTYSTTADLWLQLRPASKFSGGDKWVTLIPSSAGQMKTQFFPFTPDAWTTVPELGKPAYTFPAALEEARGLLFVGKTPNTMTFWSLRIDGYTPMCR